MRVLVAFPNEDHLNQALIDQALESLAVNCGDTFDFCTSPKKTSNSRLDYKGLSETEEACHFIVLVEGLDGQVAECNLEQEALGGAYKVNAVSGRLIHLQGDSRLLSWQHAGANRFNSIAFQEDDTSPSHNYFAPFGTFSRELGLGPIDQFGFRNDFDLAPLQERADDHAVIAIFGGSAAWSKYTLYSRCFSKLLEKKLSDDDQISLIYKKITVANFGQNDSGILKDSINFSTFCSPIRPNIVISHAGFFDMLSGFPGIDPVLFSKFGINYPQKLENWARILHKTPNNFISSIPPKVLDIDEIIRVFWERAAQFKLLVECNGGVFIQAIQPWLLSGETLHPDEVKFSENSAMQENSDVWRQRMASLYDHLSETQKKQNFSYQLDFNTYFKSIKREQAFFADVQHCRAAGDQIISDKYFSLVKSLLLKRRDS